MLRKLLLAFGAVSLCSTAIWALLLWHRLVDHSRQEAHGIVATHAASLVAAVEADPQPLEPAHRVATVERWSRQLGVRVTLLDPHGLVLVDSHGAPQTAGQPLNHPEIVAAAATGTGLAVRTGPTGRDDFLYVAHRWMHQDSVGGIIRVGLPIHPPSVLSAVIWIGSGAFASLAMAGMLAWWLSRHWTRPLAELNRAVLAIVRGSVDLPIALPGSDEIGLLARAVQRVRTRLQAQLDLIQRESKDLKLMLANIPDGVMALDSEQRILFANASMYKLFGLSTKEMATEKKLWEILRYPALQHAIAATMEQPGCVTTEFEFFSPPRVFAFRGHRLTMDRNLGLVVVLHDITELRRLERIRQEFFANVSHELKTPLSAIKLMTETLLDGALEDKPTASRFVTRIDEQGNRLHNLVIDMLALARAESRDHGFEIQPVDLVESAQSCAERFHPHAEAKRLDLRVESPHPAVWVSADPEGIATILKNLVDNAVKYTPEGGSVTLRIERNETEAAIHVADTGIGIPDEDRARVFERFYRVDKARSRALGGTGLGLSIVKHLTNAFDGTVSVLSQLDQGSTFTVRLPLADEDMVLAGSVPAAELAV